MTKHVRYTCAKKKHPVLKKDCEKCEMYKPCAKDGKWCFVGALIAEHEPVLSENVSVESRSCTEAPVLKDQSTVTIYLDNKTSVDVSKDDFHSQIKKALYSSLNSAFYVGGRQP